ncbi:hypothetical protein GUJ93_ZPchr0001g32157 [Zizania palustris]|nr:hypothetical protein GUJ93_ZPchr0001g32157 [Zizania palustris]
MQHDTDMIAELAKNAMHTLIISAETQVALWLPVPGGSFEILNKMCYDQALGGGNAADSMVLKTEATRSDGVILLDATTILEYLMDADNYRTFFPGVLSGAVTDRIFVWPTSEGYNGVIQLMTIEMPPPSPLVPGRRCTFLRYCNVLQEGAVVVVDVSLDDGNGFPRCLKMPSGILIQSIKPNTCKISVIEHVRVDDTGVHELYQPCLNGLLFGARRWIASMARQSARMRDVYLTKPTLRVSLKGRRTLLKLADDLLTSYASGIAAALSDSWIVVSGAGTENNIKIAYKKTAGEGRNDAIISASASLLLPLPMKRTFDLLRDRSLRSKWDMLVNGGVVREEVPIARGVGSDDDVTVLHVKRGGVKERSMILQNRSYDASGAFIVYSTIGSQLMNKIMSPIELPEGTKLGLYPTGFSLVPDGEAAEDVTGVELGTAGGTLMTVAFQIPLKLDYDGSLCAPSVSSAINLMTETIAAVKMMLNENDDQTVILRNTPFAG